MEIEYKNYNGLVDQQFYIAGQINEYDRGLRLN